MNIEDFICSCKKLGMVEFYDYDDEELFWENLRSESKTAHYTFNGYDFVVAKYVNNEAYVWHNGLYVGLQITEELEVKLNLFHKNYKEYLLQNKLKNIQKDFKDEDNFFSTIN